MLRYDALYDTLGYGSLNIEGDARSIMCVLDYIDSFDEKQKGRCNGGFKVIFSGQCTILFINGKKTIVRCEGEVFNYDKGAMMAFLKYALPKDQWNRLLDGFHDSTQTLRSLIKILYGEDVYDRLMKAVKDGRAKDKDNERIHFKGYMEGFKEGCKLHKEIAERRAEKKPDYPIYTDDDCKIILLRDETNAQKISDR